MCSQGQVLESDSKNEERPPDTQIRIYKAIHESWAVQGMDAMSALDTVEQVVVLAKMQPVLYSDLSASGRV